MSVIWAQEPAFDSDGRDDVFRWMRHRYGSTLRLESPKDDAEFDELDFNAELDFSADRDDLDNDVIEYRSSRYLKRTRKGRRPRAAAWYRAMQKQHPDISPEMLQELYREFRAHIFAH
jgi:hypothetical protein